MDGGGGVGNGPIPGSSALTSTSAPVFPRLRLNRRNNNSETSPIPGPSSQPSDDTQLTPRVAAPPTFPPAPDFSMTTPLDTPAARLRALLSKSPNDWSISRQRDPSFSEPDSDLDPPHGNSTSASHHESLRQLFTHALRDDTPQKPRVARRNSIDLSEVDSASPRVSRVNDERARSKQRKSLSDEELEKASRFNQSIRADRYNTLRQRLDNSDFDVDLKDIPSLTYQSRSNESSRDFAPLPRRNDPSASTSSQTNVPSLGFPSRLENDTNLLEQDLDMQDAMKGMDSFESESIPPPPPQSSSALKAANGSADPQSSARKLPVTPDTSANLSKTQTTIKKSTVAGLSRHQSLGSLPTGGSPGTSKPSKLPQWSTLSNLHVMPTPSKPSSVISEADYRSMVKEVEEEKRKEREREWNKPQTTPNRSPAHVHERVRKLSTPGSGTVKDSPHSLTAKNLELHHRRSSSRNSLMPHSPASSIASFDQERDRGVEHIRERNWNSPHPKWDDARGSPSPTPSNVSERRRALDRPSLGSRPRYDSMTSSSSSRAASPALSQSSKASVEEVIGYERERNWNSSRPSWSKRNSVGSLLPGSPSSPLQQGSSKQNPARQRTQSLKDTPSPPSDPPKVSRPTLGRSSLSHISPGHTKSPPKPPPKESQLLVSQPNIVVSPRTPPRPSVFPKAKPPFSPPKQPDLSPGWKFPATTVSDTDSESERPDKGDSTQPPASPERPRLGSRIPVRASTSAVKLDDIPKPKEVGISRHGRSFTEFDQANGAIPPRVSVQTLLPPRNLAPEDALHRSDEESPMDSPMSSTPRPGPLPLEPSPLVSGFGELSPLRGASLPLPNGGSPPKGSPKKGSPLADSPPIVISEPALSLVTPPRDASNISKMTLKTPSPPRDVPEIPELPDLPSSDGSEQSTPVMSSNLTMMNTPKPPGAWMQTPAPALRSGRARSNTLPTNMSDIMPTPLPIQRGNTFPMQTPAPPGAWSGTPGFGSVARKSGLKVRFDVTSESEAPSSPGRQDISLESIEMVHPSDGDRAQPAPSAFSRTNGVGYDEPRSTFSSFSSSDISEMDDGPRTPVLNPASVPPRTPPSVRVVDAFGREVIKESLSRGAGDVSPMTLPPQDASLSRKPSVRIVDAMGREVQQNGDAMKPDTVGEELSRAQSLAKMSESISSLAKEMDGIDLSSSSDDESDEARLKDLNEVSAKARDTREKLKQTLHAVQSGEEDWKAKYGSLRASMRKSISLPSGTPDRPFPRSRISGMLIGFIAVVQIVFILYMLRLSHVRSRQLFLSTYYEPLFPDLYLHITHPERFIQSLESATPAWSIYHVPDTWARAGWIGVLSEFAGNVTLHVSGWQRQMQEHWRNTYSRTDMPWPPT